ncbi:hypothetical protein FPOAC2_08453 [Fusarium poae]|jgi:hypothetical protein|uniref:Uncharacterized protein n=1 Tax=Fusarium poae TaxID=36050 RepID=A0A1B8ALZ1_FUSPO|nr:hypothetical protein FPOAC1_008525 [Fusarium poae]KAG8669137.1 hypothetical protein FPOAC1_008525 [Fusarium poae]OBS21364.1 hypothetical protein FPOA_07702 [Fusarium poae]
MLKRFPRFAITRLNKYNRHTPSSAFRFSSTMSSDDQQQPAQAETNGNKNPLPLPAPGSDTASSNSRGDGVTELRVGESVALDSMGPLVVNRDGTMGRIGNWAGMTEHERAQTLRLLGKRNKERLDILKAKKAAAEEEQK